MVRAVYFRYEQYYYGITVTGYSILSSDYTIGMKSSKCFNKIKGNVPWQEEPEAFSEEDIYEISLQQQ